MKPSIPPVPLSVWNNLYDAALEFQQLQPWKELDDLDLIGVRDPASDETAYGGVMGSGGTLFGLCLYRGAEGFNLYRMMISGECDPIADDVYATRNCLKLELGPKRDLLREDLAVIRQLGRTFKGPHAWPEFRSLIPGYVPWFLTEAEAELMTLGLRAVCRHSLKIAQGELTESLRERECLVYSLKSGTASDFESRWEPAPVFKPERYPPPVLNVARISAIRGRPLKPDTTWEADVFYLPSPIDEGERPYFMRMAAACQQSSGFVFSFDVLQPGTSPAQALSDLLCTSVENHGFLPDAVVVRQNEMADALAPLGRTLGVVIHAEEHLGTIRSLKEELESRVLKEGRVPRAPGRRRQGQPSVRAVYQMKVTLRGTAPRIWRRLLVPADYTLNRLHRVLQIVMGWSDEHLYEFKVGRISYGRPHPDFGDQMLNDKSIQLQEIAPHPGTSFTYIYDFGDGWRHDVKVEKILDANQGERYPRCVEGMRACPPENCGGIGGFAMLLTALEGPETAEERELVEWAGDYSPDAFDIQAVNKKLGRMKQPVG